jgi:GTP cyclohydrolase I
MEDSLNNPENGGYVKTEKYDKNKTEVLASHYSEIISLLGEDINREGLIQTPKRVAKAMQFLTQGYNRIPKRFLNLQCFAKITAKWDCKRY